MPTRWNAISASRRLLKEGHHEAGLARLREAAAQHPNSLEVMRALRRAPAVLRVWRVKP